MRFDIVSGAVFPDYELTDHTTKRRKLSELQGQHPMVLVLSRGGYCPKDRRQHEGLLQLHGELEVGYCRLVTISTDNITETNEFRSGIGAHWPFLSDAAQDPKRSRHRRVHGSGHNPMIPHTMCSSPVLLFTRFTTATGSLAGRRWKSSGSLRAVTKKCRPDWDITTPELKAAWQQGRKELFYPYGKTYAQTLGEQD